MEVEECEPRPLGFPAPPPAVVAPAPAQRQAEEAAVACVDLYVVQKCWFDGPRVEPPLDCWRLWTTSEAATCFAHASATRYAQCRAAGNAIKPVRTLLLPHSSLYGFATCGRLFWVRRLAVPLCPCLSHRGGGTGLVGGGASPPMTALARLHQGVLGASAVAGGRRGTEASYEDVARLDCPFHCPALQNWLQHQLRCHKACTWRRIPVGDYHCVDDCSASSSGGLQNGVTWWKEWGDWESWGQQPGGSGFGGPASPALWDGGGAISDRTSGGKRRLLLEEPGREVGPPLSWDSPPPATGWFGPSHHNFPNKRVATAPR